MKIAKYSTKKVLYSRFRVKMATSLSTYWVKFFTGAGFPLDVATKHAVVFSNNRIKPDMLPDLDKPSLKEMGITLMGDMIAILRYAKKVSEEMTCERFLVDNINDNPGHTTTAPISRTPITTKINQMKPVIKKVAPKITSVKNKSAITVKPISTTPKDSLKLSTKLPNTTQVMPKKKITDNACVISPTRKLISPQEAQTRKRKIMTQTEIIDSSDSGGEEWTNQIQKRLKTSSTNNNNIVKDTNNYKKLVPRQQQKQQLVNQNLRSQSISQTANKKLSDQKRTVFDRLGDSSVTSTTNSTEPNTTFNITGLGSDVLKRNSSVFNRLGDRDVKHEGMQTLNISKNGNVCNEQQPQGILKSKISTIAPTMTVKVTMNPNAHGKITTGTMRADYEKNNGKSTISSSVKQLVKTTKAMKLDYNKTLRFDESVKRVLPSKLVSERTNVLPAKARLGLSGSQKQVTFNKIATVKHIKKLGVFSRLGV